MRRAWLTGLKQLGMLLLAMSIMTSCSDPAATPNLPACKDSDWCGFDRPEDVSILDGTGWLVVTDHAKLIPLQLVSMSDPRDRIDARIERHPQTDPRFACSGKPDFKGVRGHSARRTARGFDVAVITETRIEVLEISNLPAAPRFVWIGCIEVPAHYMLNDLAFGPRGAMFASHMFGQPTDTASVAALRAAFFEGAPTGYVVHWSPATGWAKVVNTDLSFTNGVAVSADGDILAAAGTYSQKVVLVNLRAGSVNEYKLPLQPDNITALDGGGCLVAGHTGAPLSGVDPCRTPSAHPCGFPFAVVRFGTKMAPSTIFAHNGKSMAGASVAIPSAGHQILIGSAFGDGLRVIDTPKLLVE